MAKPVIEIDGNEFSTLEQFYEVIDRVLVPGASWGHNLDAFNDILRGGFGTPNGGFILRWKNADVSRERLGYGETVRQLKARLERCHPSNRTVVEADLSRAETRTGPTVFDWLVGIISVHGPAGVELELA
jgi:RNAse (barnase) inhibitor barstar